MVSPARSLRSLDECNNRYVVLKQTHIKQLDYYEKDYSNKHSR